MKIPVPTMRRFVPPLLLIISIASGMFFSGYLLYTHFLSVSSTSLLFRLCSSGIFNCDMVNSSAYSSIFGIPLAAMGLVYYLVVCALSVMARTGEDDFFRDGIYVLLFWGSLVSVLAIFPLAYISTFILSTFCLYCMITWGASIIILAVVLLDIKSGKNMDLRHALLSVHGGGIRCFREVRHYFFQILQLCLVIGVISAMVIALSGYFRVQGRVLRIENGIRMEEEILTNFYQRRPVRVDLRGIPVMYGDPRAKVTIVEYFNFDCGVCRSASPMLKSLVDKYNGKVKLYLKNFPLDKKCNPFISEEGNGLTCKAAMVSIALRKSRMYKPFVEYLMASRIPLSPALLNVAMRNSGVTPEKIRKLMSEGRARRILVSEIRETGQFNPDGTPTFVVNGRPLPSGLPPMYFFDRLIQMEVNRMYCNGGRKK